jgi:uncharacterized protein (DUF1015 family)
MPNLRPFRGIRYTSVNELGDLVCPPYDVISPEMQIELHRRHPHNAVHLELAQDGPDKYERAGDIFRSWMQQGVLTTEDASSYYVYRQDFVDARGARRRVTGIMGALELEPFGAGSVLPHEQTMPAPKKDRLALMEACPVNISPIYAIYRGSAALAPLLEALEARPAAAEFSDDAGTLHRLWVVSAPAELETIAAALREGPLVIADGHHRYETALTYHSTHEGEPGEHDAILCFCVDADAEELVVLPYHRVLKVPIATDELERRLVDNFEVRPIADDAGRALQESTADHAFAFALPRATLLVEVSREFVTSVLPERDPAWRALDVVALHEALLPRLIPEGIEATTFTKDAGEVLELVSQRPSTTGVMLRAVSPVQVVNVARSEERMPQKASYFWPKAITGLVFRPFR